MESWQIIAIFTPLLFVIYQSLSKFLPKNSSAFLVNALASLVGMVFMLILHYLFAQKAAPINIKIIWLSVVIGILISLGNFLIIKAYALGAPQSVFTSIFYPLFIVYGIIFGMLIWRESLNLIQIGGIILSILGLILVAYFRK